MIETEPEILGLHAPMRRKYILQAGTPRPPDNVSLAGGGTKPACIGKRRFDGRERKSALAIKQHAVPRPADPYRSRVVPVPDRRAGSQRGGGRKRRGAAQPKRAEFGFEAEHDCGAGDLIIVTGRDAADGASPHRIGHSFSPDHSEPATCGRRSAAGKRHLGVVAKGPASECADVPAGPAEHPGHDRALLGADWKIGS